MGTCFTKWMQLVQKLRNQETWMTSKKLTHDEHIKIVVLHEEGYSTVQIAKRIKHNQSSVSRTLSRLKKTGSVDDRKHTGRPRITTPREDRSLLRICLNDRRLTFPQLKREWMESCGVQCSSRTIRRRLVKEGLHGRVARKKPLLTASQTGSSKVGHGKKTLDFKSMAPNNLVWWIKS